MEEMRAAREEATKEQEAMEKAMTNVENIFPSIFREAVNLPTVVYQDWQGGAVKGVGTEERKLN